MSEGQTATNQQTGQRVVMRGGQWVPLGGPSNAPAQTPQSRYVAPIIGEPDPHKLSAEARADEQLRIAKAKEARDAIKDTEGTESERTAGFLATRVQGGIGDIKALGTEGMPTIGSEAARGVPLVGNYLVSEPVQRRKAAEIDVLDAALTLGTGAAYTQEQIDSYRESYFPRPGDAPGTLTDKRNRLMRLLSAARLKAGRAAPQIDAAIKDLESGGQSDNQDQTGTFDPKSGALNVTVTDETAPPTDGQTPPPGTDVGRALGLGVGDIAEAAGDTLGIVANPLNAGINAVFGTDLGTDLGQAFRDATGLPAPINETEKLASAVNKGGASALGMAGLARTGARLATGATENALARFGAAPATDTIAGGTSGAGGEYARQKGVGPVGQVLASVAAGGASIPAVSAVTRRMGPPPVMNDLMQAGQAEGVSVNRAMVDKTVAPRVTGTQATLVGGRKINSEMSKISGQIEQGVQRLGNGGTSLRESPSSAGKLVQDSAERFIKKSGKQARKIYDQAEAAAGDVKIQPQEAGQEIGSIITRLSETANTNSAEIAYLKGLEEDLGKGLSVGALRDLRTTLRQKISKGELTFGQNEARVLGIMDAISTDLENGLRSQGKEAAARLFSQADKSYRARMEFITGTVQKIIGKRNSNLSSEQVFSRFEAMARPRGDEAGLARMMRTMEPDEQADIAATFADTLGKNGKGEFSTAFLAKRAEDLPHAAKVNLFGQEGAASLERLVKLAKEHARVTGSFNNSRTGQANDYRSWLTNLLFGGGTTAIASVAGGGGLSGAAVSAAAGAAAVGGLKAGRDALSAKALMSTELTKWLATAPATTSPKAINSHFDRLKAIAARQPALQADIRQLQDRMMNAANDFTGKAAASRPNTSEEEANSRKAPGQE